MNKPAATAKAIHFVSVLLFFFLIRSESAFASEYYDDIVVSVESAPMSAGSHGYAEYGISITNNSDNEAHRVTLFAPFEGYGGGFGSGDHIRRITRSIVLSPSSSATVSIFQPPLRINGSGLGVIIDGTTQRKSVRLDTSMHCRYFYFSRYGSSMMVPLSILLSRSVNRDDFQNGAETAFPDSTGRSKYGTMWHFIKSDSPTSAWSNNWLSYSSYDGIVLTAADMRTMPASVDSALLQYVQCGGSLLVLGRWEKPERWKSRETVSGPFRINHIHFGVCVVSNTQDVTTWGNGAWKKLMKNVWGPTALELHKKATISNVNQDFPVVSNLTMPVRGMFVLVLVFAITIGPANLLILARKKKRIWMLWTVPAISIVTCTIVFAYAIAAEGWRGYLKAESITILDQDAHSATTIGINAFYCPLTPRDGLRFGYETEVTPMGFAEMLGGRARTVDWTNDQHFASGWVAARVPAHFLLRKSQMRRERLKIAKTRDNEITALNGLGADIRQLWYADEEGRIYEAENITAGAKTTLIPSGASVPSDIRDDLWRTVYSSSWARSSVQISKNPNKYLRANSYIAILDDLVFVEQALQNLQSNDSHSVVFGILGDSVDAGQGR